jgi:hypothetical protein
MSTAVFGVSAERFASPYSGASRCAAAAEAGPGPGSHTYELQWARPTSMSSKGYGGLASRTNRLNGRLKYSGPGEQFRGACLQRGEHINGSRALNAKRVHLLRRRNSQHAVMVSTALHLACALGRTLRRPRGVHRKQRLPATGATAILVTRCHGSKQYCHSAGVWPYTSKGSNRSGGSSGTSGTGSSSNVSAGRWSCWRGV